MPTHYTYGVLSELIEYDGTYKKNLLKALAYVDPYDSPGYSNWEDMEIITEGTASCCCGKDIFYAHTIQHKVTLDTLTIGSTCIGKFSDEIKKQANKRVYRINHPDAIYCALCDGTVAEKVVAQYKKYGVKKYYHKKCMKKCMDKCYGCEQFKDYNCQCYFTAALNWKFKYGKYKGETMKDMLTDTTKIKYITWLFKTTKSDPMRHIIKKAISAPTDMLR